MLDTYLTGSISRWVRVFMAMERAAEDTFKEPELTTGRASEMAAARIRPRVWIVDDDQALLTSVSEALTDAGFQTVGMKSIGELKRKLRIGCPDVLILDQWFGKGATGIEMVRQLRRRRRELPVILISAYSQAALLAQHYQVAFVEKPMTIERLTEAIDGCLLWGRSAGSG